MAKTGLTSTHRRLLAALGEKLQNLTVAIRKYDANAVAVAYRELTPELQVIREERSILLGFFVEHSFVSTHMNDIPRSAEAYRVLDMLSDKLTDARREYGNQRNNPLGYHRISESSRNKGNQFRDGLPFDTVRIAIDECKRELLIVLTSTTETSHDKLRCINARYAMLVEMEGAYLVEQCQGLRFSSEDRNECVERFTRRMRVESRRITIIPFR